MSDVARETMEKLREALDTEFSDDTLAKFKKKFRDLADDAEEELLWHVKDNMSGNLAYFVQDMAKRVVEELLRGNEAEMRRYLQCRENGWTGRDREHSVIHGELFETGAIELRKRVVDAHAELLKNERILDLEDQVRSLVEQVNKEKQRADSFWERLRDAS